AAEAAAEVPGGGRVGGAPGAQGVEEVLVGAAEVQGVQAGGLPPRGVGPRGGGVRVRGGAGGPPKGGAGGVDAQRGQDRGARQQVEGADAGMGNAAGPVGDLVVDVAGRGHGLGTAAPVGLVQAALDPALAVVQLLVYRWVHSKALVTGVLGEPVNSSNTAE